MKTIYIGGGTPTSLSAKQLDVLLKGVREQLTFDDRNEFTVEANPGDLTQEKLQVMKTMASIVFRWAFRHLMIACSKIGRKHTAADVYETMKFLEKENFTNVSIDLIYALPGQTLKVSRYFDKSLSIGLAALFALFINS